MSQTFEELLSVHGGILSLEVERFLDKCGRDTRLEHEDAWQVALITLWGCMSKFDPDRGHKFTSYLSSALRRRLLNHARQTLPTIRVGRNGNSWKTVQVVSFDAMTRNDQERVMQGYLIPDQADEAA